MKTDINDDIAGKEYWDNLWKSSDIPRIINPNDKTIRNIYKLAWNDFFHIIFKKYILKTKGRLFLEVGCGNSAILPYMNKEFGFSVTGLDYSEIGCEMSKRTAEHYNVKVEVLLCDMFKPLDSLREKFDVVYAGGVIEHFKETYKPCKAMADMTKKGGIIVNSVPNLSSESVMGKVQKRFAPNIYELHMPLDRQDLIQAHEKAGFKTLYCDYFLVCNYGVLNFEGKRELVRRYYMAKGLLKMLLKKNKLVGTAKYAPYIVYVGRKI